MTDKIDVAKRAEDANPKTLIGNGKPSVTAIPGPALLHLSLGMMNGVEKYGKYNWREKDVPICTYIDAAFRHLLAYADGEEIADDSGVHHLGHAMACCAIILDAVEGGHAIDDRGLSGTTSRVQKQMTAVLPELQQRWKEAKRGAGKV